MTLPEEVVTISEAAHILGISSVRVWQLIRKKRLPAHRMRPNMPWLIKTIDLRAEVAKREKKA
jgi:excisionase family DNA binding protein